MSAYRFVALLAALAIIPVEGEGANRRDQALDSKAVVVFQIMNAEGVVDETHHAWAGVIIQHATDRRVQEFVEARKAGLHESSVFVATLRPGTYFLKTALATRDGRGVGRFPIDRDLGSFTIEAGMIHDLGTLIFSRMPPSHPFPYFFASVPNVVSLEPYARNVLDEGAKDHVLAGRSSWDSGEAQESQLPWAAYAKANVRGGWRFIEHQGALLAPSQLGQILVRDAEGLWWVQDTGYNAELTAVAPRAGGGYLLGGERGLFLWSDSVDGLYNVSRLPEADGLVLGVTHHAGRYLAAARRDDRYVLYERDEEPGSEWQAMLELEIEEARSFVAFDDGYGYFQTDEDEVVRLDLNTRKWSTIDTDSDIFHQGVSGGFVGLYYRGDSVDATWWASEEDSWRRSRDLDAVDFPTQSEEGEVFVVGRTGDGPVGLYQFTGGGWRQPDWRKIGDLPEYCKLRALEYLSDGLMVQCVDGSIYRRLPEGAWDLVRKPFSILDSEREEPGVPEREKERGI